MITAHCPRCDESIRVPSTQVPDDAYAQCPLCRETFGVDELLDRLPPMVQFIGADGEPIEILEQSAVLASDHSGLSSDASSSFGTAATATGAAALGTAAIGLVSGSDLTDSDESDEIQEFLDDNDSSGDDGDDIESQVDDYLDDAAEVESSMGESEPSTGDTLVMDTMTMEEAVVDYDEADVEEVDVDVEDEVQQFSAVDETESPSDAIEFESDGIDHTSDSLVVEDVDLDDELAQTAEVSDESLLPTHAAQTVRSRPPAKRKKASPFKMIAGVLLGPLLALPLAGGILLAIGKAPDLGFWPFLGNGNSGSSFIAAAPIGSPNTAPDASRSNGFGKSSSLVPPDSEVGDFLRDNEAMGAEPATADSDNTGFAMPDAAMPDPTALEPAVADPTTTDQEPDSSDAPSFAFPPATPETAESDGAADAAAKAEADKIRTEEQAAQKKADDAQRDAKRKTDSEAAAEIIYKTQIPDLDVDSQAATDNDSSPAIGFPDSTAPTSSQPAMLRDMAPTEMPDSPFGDGISLDGPAETDPPEVIEAAEKASASLVQLAEKRTSGSATDRDLARVYREICLFADLEPGATSTATGSLMNQLADAAVIDDFESKIIGQWLGYSRRPTDGVLIVGTLQGTPEAAKVTLSSGETVAVSLNTGQPLSMVGRKIVAIGKIVNENKVVLSSAVTTDQ